MVVHQVELEFRKIQHMHGIPSGLAKAPNKLQNMLSEY
jgi:hypothetical protein